MIGRTTPPERTPLRGPQPPSTGISLLRIRLDGPYVYKRHGLVSMTNTTYRTLYPYSLPANPLASKQDRFP
jgi:hypothetical protein